VTEQYDFFTHPAPVHSVGGNLTKSEQFAAWKRQPGAKQILRYHYKAAAPYARRYVATGRKVSIHLIRELVRDKLAHVRGYCKRKGHDLGQWRGYVLNNTLTPMIARHLMDHRPEWRGLFELRMTKEEKIQEQIEEMRKTA